ncbi:major facilitator superfamily domain-containing protein [Fusarium avenaceum]|nr:major facilitator superfamily domain-containing protein [Fusarium avenaceum]
MATRNSDAEKGASYNGKPLSDGDREEVEHAAAHDAAARGHLATDAHGNPIATFDEAAEKRLRRKIDWCVMPTVTILYLMCFVDRANIGNARLAGLEADLGLMGYDYNILLTWFYISYIIFELPLNMTCKWMGPGWFIPATSVCFGVASLGTAFVNTMGQACAVRFILGIFEAGMLPGIAYYLSRWYRRSELAFRLAIYVAMGSFGGAFGGLLASGILTLDNFGSLTKWRMIFAIEGICTIGLAIIAFFTMTDRPSTAKWLTQEEKDLAIARIKSERVGVTEVLEKFSWKLARRGISSPVTIGTSTIFLFTNITVQGLAFFAPTIVGTIYPDETVVQKQLRTVPPYIVGTFCTLAISWLSTRLDRRNIFINVSQLPVIAGYIMFLSTTNPYVRYAGTFLICAGTFANGALSNAQLSANLVTDTARASGIGLNVMLGNVGGLISTWCFLASDGPDYPIGNGLNLGACLSIFLLTIVLHLFMSWDNKRRARIDVDQALAGHTTEEIRDLDWKHPGFSWRP